jgi:uncharacterized protein (DUF305 family)
VPSLTARVAAVLVALAAALFLSSCHHHRPDDQAHARHLEDEPLITDEPVGHSTEDLAFATNIIANQEQSFRMSQPVPDHTDNSALVEFATTSAAVLQQDTQTWKALRVQWQEGGGKETGSANTEATLKGMIDNATLAKLDSLHGSEFDTLWLRSMINHDRGAIEMANTEVAKGSNEDAIRLAKQIVEARQADIGRMRQLLGA